jgi:hypothetical protein
MPPDDFPMPPLPLPSATAPTTDWVLCLHLDPTTVQVLALTPDGGLPLRTVLPRCRCQASGLWRLLEIAVGHRRRPVRAVISAAGSGRPSCAQIFCMDAEIRSTAAPAQAAAVTPASRARPPAPARPAQLALFGPGDHDDR